MRANIIQLFPLARSKIIGQTIIIIQEFTQVDSMIAGDELFIEKPLAQEIIMIATLIQTHTIQIIDINQFSMPEIIQDTIRMGQNIIAIPTITSHVTTGMNRYITGNINIEVLNGELKTNKARQIL